MKCANCGAELKVGCVYCSVCGTEAQIVSDYNLLEDDFLRGLLKEKKEKIHKKHLSEKKKKNRMEQQSKGKEEAPGKQKIRKKKKPIWILAVAVLLILVLAIVITGMQRNV